MLSELNDAAGINVLLAILVVVANVPLYWLMYRILFDDVDELADAIKFWFTPEIISAFRGEHVDDIWAELKLGALVVCSVGLVVLEYIGIQSYLVGGGAV